jgi:hypothetical protein
MKTFIYNENTGETKVSLRPYDETVSLVLMILGCDVSNYTDKDKSNACFFTGVYIYTLDTNGQTLEGLIP